MYILYILICDEWKYYVWITSDLERRLSEHNGTGGKKTRFTRKYSNWTVFHTETYNSLLEAQYRESEIKSWKGGNIWKEFLERTQQNS